MGKVSDILDRLCSQTASKWREMTKYRREHKSETHKYVQVALMILDKMSELRLTAEHVSNDADIPLEELRDIVSGKYPISELNKKKLSTYLKIEL